MAEEQRAVVEVRYAVSGDAVMRSCFPEYVVPEQRHAAHHVEPTMMIGGMAPKVRCLRAFRAAGFRRERDQGQAVEGEMYPGDRGGRGTRSDVERSTPH